MDSAAIRLSRMDMIARPVREFTRFSTINSVISTRITPMVKVAAFGVPVMPCAPLMMTTPVESMPREVVSLIEKWKPAASFPTYITLMRFLMISPNANVTIAR